MRENTKLDQVRTAMAANDWDRAILLAAKFRRLGEATEPVQRGAAAIKDPRAYKEMGHDVDRLRQDAVAALKERFSQSWNAVSKEKAQGKREEPPESSKDASG